MQNLGQLFYFNKIKELGKLSKWAVNNPDNKMALIATSRFQSVSVSGNV